jgi:hypothetical protein
MQITDIKRNEILVKGADYFRVLKVNRVTVDVVGQNGNKVRAYPHIFDRRADPLVNAIALTARVGA